MVGWLVWSLRPIFQTSNLACLGSKLGAHRCNYPRIIEKPLKKSRIIKRLFVCLASNLSFDSFRLKFISVASLELKSTKILNSWWNKIVGEKIKSLILFGFLPKHNNSASELVVSCRLFCVGFSFPAKWGSVSYYLLTAKTVAFVKYLKLKWK